MKNQYEQQCNAEALKEMGYPVLKTLNLQQIKKISTWIADESSCTPNPFPDHSNQAVEQLIQIIISYTMKNHCITMK